MTNLELRLSGLPSELSESEKTAVLQMASLITAERTPAPVVNPNVI